MLEEYWWRKRTIISGFDIGKKGNPSHHSVFAIDDDDSGEEILIMLHQKFLDSWEYTRQIEYIKDSVKYFNIQRMYFDNTRGEFEERSLPRQCIPVVLGMRTGRTAKGKMELATNLAKLVETRRIRLLDDDRFISQILCVSNDLQAPKSPMGHGDSFISIMLAVGVYFDFFAKDRSLGFSYLGNTQDLLSIDSPTGPNPPEGKTNEANFSTRFDRYKIQNICKVCGSRNLETLSDGTRMCTKCFTKWEAL